MKLYKHILRTGFIFSFLAWIINLYIKFVYKTGNWKTIHGDIPQKFWDQDKPFILCFWHGRLLMIPHAWKPKTKKKFFMLISDHPDGVLISKAIGHMGLETVSGSSGKDGSKALRSILRIIGQNGSIGITPDGPRGPRMRVSSGIIKIASKSGLPIIPVTYSAKRGKIISSWDRFLLPSPFSHGVIIWGEPLFIEKRQKENNMEYTRLELETALNDITHQADTMCQRIAIKPASLLKETTLF